MKDFVKEEERMREELTPLLTVNEVCAILKCEVNVVFRLIEAGHLEAYDIFGRRISTNKVAAQRSGIRLAPSSLHEHLQRGRVS